MPDLKINLIGNDRASGKIKGITTSILQAVSAQKILNLAFRAGKEAIELAIKNSTDFKKEFTKLQETTKTLTNIFTKGLGDGLSSVLKQMNKFLESKEGLELIGNVITGISLAFNVLKTYISNVIKTFGDLVKAVIESGKLVGSFFEALTGKKKWSDFKKQAQETGETWKRFAGDIADTFKNTFETAKTGIQNFNKNSLNYQKEYLKEKQKIEKENNKKAEEESNRVIERIKKEEEEKIKAHKESEKRRAEASKKWAEEQKRIAEENTKNWISAGQQIGEAFANAFNEISNIVKEMYNRQIADIDYNLQKELSLIDKQTQEKLKMYGLEDKTKKEQIEKRIQEIKEALRQELDETEQAKLQEELFEQEKALKKEQILQESETRKNEAELEAKKKKYELEVQAFNTDKGFKIAQIWINYAMGLVSLWSSSMSLGPIAGPIVAGIITGILTAIAGAQTGVVASQQPPPPPFAEGGIMENTGLALVGERGRELVSLPAGAEVINNTNTERILKQMNKDIIVNIYLDSILIKKQLIKISKNEAYAY